MLKTAQPARVTALPPWSADEWKWILGDAEAARRQSKLLRRMGARSVRRWADRTLKQCQRGSA